MKKLFSLVLAALLLLSVVPASAAPETVDLGAMSLDELRALEQRIVEAMWASDAWQSVEVPVGAYKVGTEIPEGKWTVTATPGNWTELFVCTAMNASGTDPDGDWLTYEVIADKDNSMFESYPVQTLTIDVKAGVYIVIKDAPVLFTPYSGPSFTFK